MLMTDSLTVHIEALKLTRGVRGVYRRGSDEVEAVGIPGRTGYVGDDMDGLPAIDLDSEWLFDPKDLFLNGEQITPREKDTWTAFISGSQVEFKILPNAITGNPFEWSNGYRSMIRVSAKSRGVVNG